jgi:aldehyde dehydrogenase (NAD+)
VFADVTNQMRIAREEIFGPVVGVIKFKTEEEAVAIANDTEYGLVAGIWTRNVGRAHRVAAQIQAGMVWVNTYRFIRYNIPYGGYKVSGLNRENGAEGLEPYFETKSTIINLGGAYPDAYAQ